MQADQEVEHLIAADERPPRRGRLAAAVAPHADVARPAARSARIRRRTRTRERSARRSRASTAPCRSAAAALPPSRAFARCSSCRELSAVVPSISAISAWSYSKMSFSRNTARSSGDSFSSSTRNASVTDSARCSIVVRALHLRGEHRLGQPRPDVFLARRPRGLQPIEAETRDDGRRERLRRANRRSVDAAVAQPCVLQHVLRVRRASEHPVRDREQQRPIGVEDVLVHRSRRLSKHLRKPVAHRRVLRPPAELRFRVWRSTAASESRSCAPCTARPAAAASAGTLSGAGDPVYSAIASTISVRLTARSSTMS